MYMSINGKKLASTEIRSLLASKAHPVIVAPPTQNATTKSLDTVAKQGGGLIDTFYSVYTSTRAFPTVLALNDTKFFAGRQTFTLTNTGSRTQKYTFTHKPAGTLSTYEPKTGYAKPYPVPISNNGQAKVTISPERITIPRGHTRTITVTFQRPAGLNEQEVPVYSGFIDGVSDEGKAGSVSIPYLGVAADTTQRKVLDTTDQWVGVPLPALLDGEGNPVNDDKHTFTLNGTDAPGVAFRLVWGSALETVDLVAANSTFKPTIPINDGTPAPTRRGMHKVHNARHNAIHAARLTARSDLISESGDFSQLAERAPSPPHKPTKPSPPTKPSKPTKPAPPPAPESYASVQTIGNVFTGNWVSRDSSASPGFTVASLGPTVATTNGTATVPVADGQYRLLLRVRKPFRNFQDEASYESYLSHAFTIQH